MKENKFIFGIFLFLVVISLGFVYGAISTTIGTGTSTTTTSTVGTSTTSTSPPPTYITGNTQTFSGEPKISTPSLVPDANSQTNIYGSSSNPQFYPPGYSGYNYNSRGDYWSGYGASTCVPGQDLMLIIPPGGCSPSVVRSDLLEEQNVPVFCKVSALQINPLIDVTRIRSLTFRGKYPEGISGISYFPARSAVGGQRYLGNEIYKDNLGYLVVVLKRQKNEKSMPDFVAGNISAVVYYDSESGFGLGDSNFYLNEMSDREWERDYKEYGFWNGKGYVRVDSIEDNQATISIYRDFQDRQETVTLKEGETSRDIYLSGFYCGAGLKVKLDRIGYPVDSALLQVEGDQIWVSKGDKFLDNKCNVLELDAKENNGKIKIKCPGSKVIELSLGAGKAVFGSGVGGKAIGEKISENVYLAYLGQDSVNNRYAVLVKDLFSKTENEFKEKGVIELIEKEVGNKKYFELKKDDSLQKKVREYYASKKYGDVVNNVSVDIVQEGSEGNFGVRLGEIQIAKNRNWDYGKLSPSQILSKEYYDKAIVEYESLAELYPNEKREYVEEDAYASQGLLESARLSKKLGMDAKAQELYKKLLENYPNSYSALAAERESTLLSRHDTSNSKASVKIANNNYFIDLLQFKKPAESDANAVMLIDGMEEVMTPEKIKTLRKENFVHSFKITSMRDEYVDVSYEKTGGELKNPVVKKKRLKIGESALFEGIEAKVLNVNLKKQVKLSLVAKSYGPGTESSFQVKIGIEKRAIKISPEKAEEMMKNLKEAIKKWEDINRKLGNVIKGLKAACFATSAVLTVKSMLEGASGKSMARKTLMQNSKAWNEKCEELVSKGQYSSLHQCLLDKSSEVEGDIDKYSSQIQKTNDIMKGIQDKVGRTQTDIFDFQGQVDSGKVNEEFKKTFDDWCKTQTGNVALAGQGNTPVSFTGMNGVCSWDGLTHEQRRDIMTWQNTKNSGGSDVLKDVANEQLGRNVLEAKNYQDNKAAQDKAEQEANSRNLGVRTTTPEGDSIVYGDVRTIGIGDKSHDVYKNFDSGSQIIRVYIPAKKSFGMNSFSAESSVAGRQVIVPVKYNSEDGYFISDPSKTIYDVDGNKLSDAAAQSVRDYLGFAGMNKIKQSDKKAYQNRMRDSQNLRVKYFDKAPYRGLPAEIPFDVENGWYVEMSYVLSGFGQPYEQSGRVLNFYICNVGQNGLIEFKKSADDICRYYNAETGADINFPGLSVSESKELISKAQRAVQEASRQYGKERVTINGKSFKSGVSLNREEGRCTDFMSVQDCTLLFNVCDPVICPASRCDFGGRYRVDDVVQSGIVGSLLLCLPNFKEGVMVPICLSGVHAGLEGYISILNSTVQCLNESIETGREIGICDEIKSIYLCDFFWRQAVPLMDVVLPRMFEGLYGQGARGGGEYLTVQSAWNNMKNSAGYFTQNYAINSVKAFNERSISYAWESIGEDIGVEICKGFISANFGSAKNMFKALIEPDSPEQYHAWFSEQQMTSATVPAQSHYKVYYHIYAGKDIGSQYVVYLKDLPRLENIHSTGYFVVARGYVNRGSQVDEARDFIAVSGFKQLCVSINGRDECGFGKVSTSYALNALSESFVAEQLKDNIKSEKECVAGTPSFGSLLQPNLQAGVEELINPELYNKGIIRICASENPGKQVSASGKYDTTNSTYDRWKDVGYCDDPKIRCWMDTESVKDVIVDKALEKGVLREQDVKDVFDRSGYWTVEESQNVAQRAESFINNLVIDKSDTKESIEKKISLTIRSLNDLTNYGITNVYKARAHYLLGNLYRKITEKLWEMTDSGSVIYGEIEEDTSVVYDEVPYDEDVEENIDEESSTGGESGTSGESSSGTEDVVGRNVIFYLGQNKYIYKKVSRNNKDIKTIYYLKGKVIYREEKFIFDWINPDNEVGRVEEIKGDPIKGIFRPTVIINKEHKNENYLKELDGLYFDSVDKIFYKYPDEDETLSPEFESEETIWKDEMLKEGILIQIGGGDSSRKYRFFENGWRVYNDNSFKLNLNYVQGVSDIVKQANANTNFYIGSAIPENKLGWTSEDTYDSFLNKVFEELKKSD